MSEEVFISIHCEDDFHEDCDYCDCHCHKTDGVTEDDF